MMIKKATLWISRTRASMFRPDSMHPKYYIFEDDVMKMPLKKSPLKKLFWLVERQHGKEIICMGLSFMSHFCLSFGNDSPKSQFG